MTEPPLRCYACLQGDQEALRDALKEDEQGKGQEDRDHVAMRKLAQSYSNPLRQQSAEDALQALLHSSQMTHQQAAVLEVHSVVAELIVEAVEDSFESQADAAE